MSYLTNPDSGLPPRGTVLCIFEDSISAVALERQFVSKGYTVLRARHAMHGYWLAISSRPDVVITDLIDPGEESDYLVDLLKRNQKTCSLPIIAMVDNVRQTEPAQSCLRMVDVCLRSDAPVDDIVAKLDALVEKNHHATEAAARSESAPKSTNGVFTRFDDYFARLGESELQKLRPKPHRRSSGHSPEVEHATVPVR